MRTIKNAISEYFSDDLNRIRFAALLIFIGVITLLAWQSDDAYHAYIMAKNLVEGNGFVYNVGERATASSCPLFTLVIAFGYLFIRKMFVVSLLICIIFSASAFGIFVHRFCESRLQVIMGTTILLACVSFVSYTTAGLENCMLYFLCMLFLKEYFNSEEYTSGKMLKLAVLISLIAMTRMDAVLMFVPMIVYLYLFKRKNVSFLKAVGLGALGLSPFIIWELFSLIYYGFFVPNTAFVKLGTNIPRKEYLVRGIQYALNAVICDPLVLFIPFLAVVCILFIHKSKYVTLALGVVLYGIYVIYIGGDFMMGRHFTVIFLMSVTCYFEIYNKEFEKRTNVYRNNRLKKFVSTIIICCIVYTVTTPVITQQFQFGNKFSSPIADERAGYFKWTSLFNNAVSYFTTGEMCIQDAWNDQGVRDIREAELPGGILKMVPGITKYYNNDLYLNDLYALGDPYLSKLPAVREANWRIGHMYREAPKGYYETVYYGSNVIENEAASEYYEIIKLITRGNIFDKDRLQAVIDINLGKYDYLVSEYQSTLDENNMQK